MAATKARISFERMGFDLAYITRTLRSLESSSIHCWREQCSVSALMPIVAKSFRATSIGRECTSKYSIVSVLTCRCCLGILSISFTTAESGADRGKEQVTYGDYYAE